MPSRPAVTREADTDRSLFPLVHRCVHSFVLESEELEGRKR